MKHSELANRAVARGMAWLDANVPHWRKKLDVATLDLQWPCKCVLGQIDGDFYEAVWKRKLTRDQVFQLGFSAPKGMRYGVLTAAWYRAIMQWDRGAR